MSEQPLVTVTASPHLAAWLHDEQLSLAFTTYQTNRLFLVGLKPDGQLSVFERLFDRPMGLCARGERLYLSTRYQVWQLDNARPPGQDHDDYDRVYVPRVGTTTGDLDVHDVAWLDPASPLAAGAAGPVIFVSTLYSCLATLSDRYSFRPVWQPPFIGELAPEDRCHLNGLAMQDGRPRYVTAVSRSDVASGWRQRRAAGGCLVDVPRRELVLTELSMPHSPRVYRDRVWLLNSGTGELGMADPERGRFEPAAFCPGYLRGLAFHKKWAIVGLSRPRHNRTLSDLAVDGRLAAAGDQAHCGLAVVDLDSGQIVHRLEIEGIVTELYDVQALPGVRRPMALGFKSDEIYRLLTLDVEPAPCFAPLVALEEAKPPLDFIEVAGAPPSPPSPPPPPPEVMPPSETVPPAETVQRVSRPAGGTAVVRTLDNSAYRFQLSTDMSVAAVVREWLPLTFPPLDRQAVARPIREPLTATVARYGDAPVGMALAELPPPDAPERTAQVISLCLAPEHRGRRLSYNLLRALEKALARQGCTGVTIRYRGDWESAPALERLLAGQAWQLSPAAGGEMRAARKEF